MNIKTAAVIMSAGKSTRMKSALPKAAHKICGKAVTRHVIDACRDAGIEDIVVVVGYEAEIVKEALGDDVLYALQSEQLGTGHACMQAMPHLGEDITQVIVLPGDAPLIRPQTLSNLMNARKDSTCSASLLSAILPDAGHYGRVIRDAGGNVQRILEAKDADEKALAIREINAAIYCFDKSSLAAKLALLRTDNAQKEYYLTDVIEMLAQDGSVTKGIVVDDAAETLGINNKIELAEAAAIVRQRILQALMLDGVSIVDPLTTYIDCDVQIGRDTLIHPCTVIEGGSRIGCNCVIGPFARLSGVSIADGTAVR